MSNPGLFVEPLPEDGVECCRAITTDRIEELYRRFSGWLRQRAHGRDAQFVDDAVQDRFKEFYRKGDVGPAITKNEEAWLAYLCRKRLIDAGRDHRRRQRLHDDSTPPMGPERSPLQEETLAAVRVRLESVLPTFSLRQQSVVFFRLIEDCPFEEIGQRLQIPPKTAKTLWYRALDELRCSIQPPDSPDTLKLKF